MDVYRDVFKRNIVPVDKVIGNFSTKITHNYCNNTSWPSSNDSSWELKPGAGKIWTLNKAEVQFQHDLDLSGNTIYIDYYAWVGGGSEAVVEQIAIDSVVKIYELGNEHYYSPALPGFINPNVGLSTVVFNYIAQLVLYADDTPGSLSKVKIYTQNDSQVTGSYATVGFIIQES